MIDDNFVQLLISQSYYIKFARNSSESSAD